jgi:hypothetical protein
VIDLTREKLFGDDDAKSALKIQREVTFSEVADDSLVKEVQRDMKIKGR